MARETHEKQTDRIFNKQELIIALLKNLELILHGLFSYVHTLKPSDDPAGLYNEQKAAQIIDVSKKKLYNLRIEGKITFIEIDGCIRYSKQDIEEYINKQRRRIVNGKSQPVIND